MKVLNVAGARANLMKIAPVLGELETELPRSPARQGVHNNEGWDDRAADRLVATLAADGAVAAGGNASPAVKDRMT
jgi:hypothetical protein